MSEKKGQTGCAQLLVLDEYIVSGCVGNKLQTATTLSQEEKS
jgi:hypothetical protein